MSKVKHPALLEMENERLRGLLREIDAAGNCENCDAARPAQTELVEALRLAVEYLDSNNLNSIASGSSCHLKMRSALAAQGVKQ